MAESAEHVCFEAEKMLEGVDASENTEIPGTGAVQSIRAALLQYGHCLAHIVRESTITVQCRLSLMIPLDASTGEFV